MTVKHAKQLKSSMPSLARRKRTLRRAPVVLKMSRVTCQWWIVKIEEAPKTGNDQFWIKSYRTHELSYLAFECLGNIWFHMEGSQLLWPTNWWKSGNGVLWWTNKILDRKKISQKRKHYVGKCYCLQWFDHHRALHFYISWFWHWYKMIQHKCIDSFSTKNESNEP